MPRRDTFNYAYRVGRKVSHRGITNNPKRRQAEHRRSRQQIFSTRFHHRSHRVETAVYTDDASAYECVPRLHQSVKHSDGEYVRNEAGMNGIVSLRAMLKRGIYGVYHQVSVKHLHRYATEFSGRHNARPADTIGQVNGLIKGIEGKRLRYHDLIA